MADDTQIQQDAETPDCPECGHRGLEHRQGKGPCLMPGCPCSIGRDKPAADAAAN